MVVSESGSPPLPNVVSGRPTLRGVGALECDRLLPKNEHDAATLLSSSVLSTRPVNRLSDHIGFDMIHLTCDGCHSSLQIGDLWAGKLGRCPYCGTNSRVPGYPKRTPKWKILLRTSSVPLLVLHSRRKGNRSMFSASGLWAKSVSPPKNGPVPSHSVNRHGFTARAQTL